MQPRGTTGKDYDATVKRQLRDDTRFRILRVLQQNPNVTQRDIADGLGVSLGSVNYVLNALIEKGLVKARNFRNSQNKIRYAYYLTPKGVSEKARLTAGFLRRKLSEYEALKAEIKALEEEMHAGDVTWLDGGPEPHSSEVAARVRNP